MNSLIEIKLYSRSHPFLSFNLLLLLAIGFFFRGVALDRLPAINGDEAYTSVQMAELGRGNQVDLKLPTHRTLSPLYGLYIWTIEKALPGHNFWKVRFPALIAGILLVVISFVFLRWVLPSENALFASILIASLPVNIAYSRSAVEQSLMGLASFFPLYFALEGSFFSAFCALALAAVIHPVNIFLVPVVVSPLLAILFHAPHRTIRVKFSWIFGLLSLSLVIIFGLLHFLPSEIGWLNIKQVLRFLWTSPLGFFKSGMEFLLNYIRLLSGFSTYEYFSDTPPPTLKFLWDMGIGLVLILSLCGLPKLKQKQRWREFYYVLGFICMLTVFFFIAGPRILSVGLSRHGTFLIVPSAIALAILIPSTLPRLKFHQLFFGFLGVGWLFLLHFYLYYFQSTLKTGGGITHRTYISGPVEPKAAAFQWILVQSGGKAKILAEDWWIYWPVKYLALSHPGIEVILLGAKTEAETFDHSFNRGAYAMGFPGGPIHNHLQNRFKNAMPSLQVFQPPSYANERTLRTWKWVPNVMN